MNSPIKMAVAAAAAVLAVSVVALNVVPGDPGSVGGPGTASPTPVASPSLEPSPSPSQQADRMTVAGSNTGVTIELPAGWDNGDIVAAPVSEDPAKAAVLFLTRVGNTFEDPCANIERNPPIDPTVEAAATALGETPGALATAPVETTIGAYDATYLELTIPGSLPCEPRQFNLIKETSGGEPSFWALERDEVILFWIVDVGGEPVAIAGRTFAETSDATRAELEAIVDTIVFDEPSTPSSASPGATP